MTRLIDADKLHTLFDEKCASECAICTYYENCKDNLYCGLIDLAPTVEERPQGEWTTRRKGLQVFFDCSNCGESICAFPSPYCPYCGADMREADNDKI